VVVIVGEMDEVGVSEENVMVEHDDQNNELHATV